jgi:predicted AAA+ superfamily ATPase
MRIIAAINPPDAIKKILNCLGSLPDSIIRHLFPLPHICHDYIHAGKLDLNYWRSTSAFEVDFILAHKTAIEVKASQNVTPKMLKGLKGLQEEKFAGRHVCVCLETAPRKTEGVEIVPFKLFLQALWQGEFI